MKKRIILSALVAFVASITFAQTLVQWNYSTKKIADKTYEVHLTATIDDNWHLYSQRQPEDAIAMPTAIKFTPNPLLIFTGIIKEIGKMEKHTDKTLGITQNQYSNKVDFVQVVKLKGKAKTNVSGDIQYQACTDENCLPPKTVQFSVSLQ